MLKNKFVSYLVKGCFEEVQVDPNIVILPSIDFTNS